MRKICWILSVVAATSQPWPASRGLADETLNLGVSTRRFKEDIINLFRSDRYAARTAIDIGTGWGYTAAALAVNFGMVLATEVHWDLGEAMTGKGYNLNRSKLLRRDGSTFSNILSLHLDASIPHAFGQFAAQNISACVIDAQHDFQSVVRDTFAVLRQITCCVETIIYHDYCDQEVFEAVQSFVNAGLLTYRRPIGTPHWDEFWCREGRPEGAAMRVLRNEAGFHVRLEALHQRFLSRTRSTKPSIGASLGQLLDGSTWLLFSERKQLCLLSLGVHPGLSFLYSLKSQPDVPGERWMPELMFPLGGAKVGTLSYRQLPHLEMPVLNEPGSIAEAELDRDLNLMHLRLNSQTSNEPWVFLGFRQDGWVLHLQRLIDNFIHLDSSASRATDYALPG